MSNVTGSDLQNFNATTSGLDFITVHSSETLIPGITNLGLFTNYATNTLPRYGDDGTISQNSSGTDDAITAADINIGFGVAKGLDVGLSLPFVINQTVNSEGSRGEFEAEGLTEVRANVKYRLLGDASQGIATIFSVNQNLTANNPFSGEGGGPILNFEMAFDTSIYKTAIAFNIGYRLRNAGAPIEGFPIEPIKDQIIASAAISQHFSSIDTKLILEVFGSSPVEDSTTVENRSVSAGESLIGIKYDINRNVAAHLGASKELSNGTSSPDIRFYAGLNFVEGIYSAKTVRLDEKRKKKKKRKKRKKKAPPAPIPTPEPETFLSSGGDDYPEELPGVGDRVFVLRDVNFAFDSAYQVLEGAKQALKELADHLKEKGYRKVIIEGHTDSVGTQEYNIDLGRRRAERIAGYLVKVEGLDRNRLNVLTYGEYRPVADNGNFQGRQHNRRVVFRILY